MLLRLLSLAIILSTPIFYPKASAYEFSPIVAQFTAQGSGSTRTFVVRNNHSEPIALQIEVFRRTSDALGNEQREPEYDDFIVTPPQLVLAPGRSQSIRARWVGGDAPDIEQSYRFVVTQLPIKYKREDVGNARMADVKMGFRYEAAIYVLPTKGSPSAEIIHSEAATSTEGQRVLRLTVQSTGTRRAILQNPVVTVTSSGQSVELSGEDVFGLDDRNIIAGSKAVIDLPWPEELPVGPITASLKTRYFIQ